MQLRPYQMDLIDKTRRALKVHRRVLLQAPTGAGKTALSAFMLKETADRGRRAWFVVHRRELVQQTSETLARFGANHGFIAAGFPPSYRRPITVCSVQTLAKRLDRLNPPDLVIWDEAHHCAAGTWGKVSDFCPNALHVGLTATPERLDGKGLAGMFSALIPGPPVNWLIEQGYLAPYRLWSKPVPDLADVRVRGADYESDALSSVVDQPHILGDAVAHYRAICPGAQAVAFCVNVQHALNTRDAFRAAGIAAEELDGTIDRGTRQRVVRAFRRGEIQVLTSIDLFGEGFDLPELQAAILLRPTKSLGLYLQQVGRALRASPNKPYAVILDHAGNAMAHGLPDEARDWNLEGRTKRKGALGSKICDNCFAANHPGAACCVACGAPFARETIQRDPVLVDGVLVEVDPALLAAKRRAEIAAAKDRAALEAVAAARGYRAGWVDHILRARAAQGRG